MKRYFYLAISAILLYTSSFAQSNVLLAANTRGKAISQGTITGKVIDEVTSSPIEYANVVLMSKQDSKMVSGIASNQKGEFLLNGISNGNYDLVISFVGFKKKTINDVQITENNYSVNLSVIKLQPLAVQMKENEVVADKSAMEFKIDKKVVNVSQNLSAAGGTAVDVLQNQPSVQIDANGNLTLRGSGNFTVMVDGRPSVLSGTDALRQIPANIIDNIEIITNPSAKYDAEGTAGIINIVTKKTNLTSTSGIVNSGAGSRDKYNGDFNLSYRDEDFNITLGGDARRFNYMQDINVDRSAFNISGVTSSADLHSKRDAYTGRFSFDKYFSDKVTLGINGSIGYTDFNMGVNTYNNSSNFTDPALNSYSVTNDRNNTTAKYFNGSINLTNVFTPKVNDLYFEATFTKLELPSDQITTETISSPTSQVKIKGRENNTSRIDSRIKLNYKHNLADKNVFETGLQANLFYKKIDIVSKDFNSADQTWTINNAFSNNFDFRNNVYAGFATYSDQVLGLEYQAGLRLEYTDRLLDQITTGTEYKYQKLHFFPTLNISEKLPNDQQLQFSYSRRIQRPFDGQLNPFTYFSDTYTATGGNPYLVPSFTHSIELNYQKSFSGVYLTVQTYFRKTDDGIDQIQVVDNTGRLNLTFANTTNSTSIGSEISANITFAPWFKMDPSLNIYNFSLKAVPEYAIPEQNNFSWDARLNTTLMLSAATRLQFFTNYYPKNVTSQGEIKSFMIIGASVRQEFFERQLIATLSAQNLFGQTKYNIISNGTGFTSNLNVRPEAPIFNLTLSYNFNNFKRRNNEQVDVNVNTGF